MKNDLKNTITMDENAIWTDMISNTTRKKGGAHSVNMKTSDHEVSKIADFFLTPSAAIVEHTVNYR